MLESEDMSCFMCGDVHGSSQALTKGRIAFCRIAIAMDRPNADALPGLGFTEDVVALGTREEIAGCEAEIGEGIVGAIWLEHLVQNIGRTDLVCAPFRMDTAGVVGNYFQGQFTLDCDWSLEKQAEVLLRDFQNVP